MLTYGIALADGLHGFVRSSSIARSHLGWCSFYGTRTQHMQLHLIIQRDREREREWNRRKGRERVRPYSSNHYLVTSVRLNSGLGWRADTSADGEVPCNFILIMFVKLLINRNRCVVVLRMHLLVGNAFDVCICIPVYVFVHNLQDIFQDILLLYILRTKLGMLTRLCGLREKLDGLAGCWCWPWVGYGFIHCVRE